MPQPSVNTMRAEYWYISCANVEYLADCVRVKLFYQIDARRLFSNCVAQCVYIYVCICGCDGMSEIHAKIDKQCCVQVT